LINRNAQRAGDVLVEMTSSLDAAGTYRFQSTL
jgi:hypothetical protein